MMMRISGSKRPRTEQPNPDLPLDLAITPHPTARPSHTPSAVFELPEFLVITRSQQTGELMAYHSSHRSHSSHSSHQSHYSSR